MNNIQEMINNLLFNNSNNCDNNCNNDNQDTEISINDLFEPIYSYLNLLIQKTQLTEIDYLNLLSIIQNERNSEFPNRLLNSFIDIVLYNIFNNLAKNSIEDFNNKENNFLSYLPFDPHESQTADEQILKDILHDRIRNKIL